MADVKDNLSTSAKELVGNMFYTAIFDTCNEVIAAGIGDENAVLECGNNVAKKYAGEGIKVRKKPTPRVTKPKVASNPTDAVTAASKKMKQKMYEQFVWIAHPSNAHYMYTTSVQLATGYPVKEAQTNKIVGIINDNTCTSLSQDDAKVALSLGLQVDYQSVAKPSR